MGAEGMHVPAVAVALAPVAAEPQRATGAGPAAPVPVSGLVVGSASDGAERDADQRADSAMDRLRRAASRGDGVRRATQSSAIGAAGGPLDDLATSRIERLRGHGDPLPTPVRGRMERAFGTSFGAVRIHSGDEAAELSSSMSALAFTTGQDVFFGRGQYSPDTPGGERVLAHELAHTQQGPSGIGRLMVRRILTDQRKKDNPVVVDISAITTPDTCAMYLQLLDERSSSVSTDNWLKDVEALKLKTIDLVFETADWDTADEVRAATRLADARRDAEAALRQWETVRPTDVPSQPAEEITALVKRMRETFDAAKVEGKKLTGERVAKLTTTGTLSGLNFKTPGSRTQVLNVKRASNNATADLYLRASSQMKQTGLSIGLPSADAQTLTDWKGLEAAKGRAAEVRAPIDTVLQRHVAAMNKILPEGTLNYRGSLARGVKSPKKVAQGTGATALVQFDQPFAELNPPRGTRTDKGRSFDLDVNIDIPDSEIKKLGLVEGSVTTGRTAVGEGPQKIYDGLIELQKVIRGELGALGIPGLEADKFEFFLFSSSTSTRQLNQGTPYPPYMLANAGMPGLAENLPQASSDELLRRLDEYALTRGYQGRSTTYLAPLRFWDKYYVDLNTHIEKKGPLATFMPEVQVRVLETGARSKTFVPRVEETAAKPSKLVDRGFTWLPNGVFDWAKAPLGTILVGVVTGQTKDRSASFIEIGPDKQGICYKTIPVGTTVIVSVDKLPKGKSPVLGLLKTLKG